MTSQVEREIVSLAELLTLKIALASLIGLMPSPERAKVLRHIEKLRVSVGEATGMAPEETMTAELLHQTQKAHQHLVQLIEAAAASQGTPGAPSSDPQSGP